MPCRPACLKSEASLGTTGPVPRHGPFSSVPCRAWAGPKSPCLGPAHLARPIWPPIALGRAVLARYPTAGLGCFPVVGGRPPPTRLRRQASALRSRRARSADGRDSRRPREEHSCGGWGGRLVNSVYRGASAGRSLVRGTVLRLDELRSSIRASQPGSA